MKNSYYKIIVLLIIVQALVSSILKAQNERSLYYMRQIPQASYANPAFTPEFNFYISIPGASSVYAAYNNNGFKYADVITRRADDSLVLNQHKLLNALGTKNDIGIRLNEELFALGFKAGKNYISLSLNTKAIFDFHYTKDFMALLINGNSQFLGKSVDLSGASANGIIYGEAALGFARQVNSKLSVGARIKYLYGAEDIETKNSKLSLSTDQQTFALTAVSNIQVNMAQPTGDNNKFDINSIFSNPGMAFDFGVNYALTHQISLNASILDIGSITWNKKVTNYISEKPNSSFTFSGIDINEFFKNKGTSDSTFNHLLDTINNKFKVKESHNSFKTTLPLKFIIGASYKLDSTNIAGIIIRNEFFDGNYNPSFTLSINHEFGRILSGVISYSYVDRNFLNIGAGFALNLGPLQIYGVVDNAIAAMQITKSQTVNAQVGLNFVFGYARKKKGFKEPYIPRIPPSALQDDLKPALTP
jgi:hypothetical protein